MKKITYLIAIALIAFSCTKDQGFDTTTADDALNFDSFTENNNLGIYKGVFTTLDSEVRGIIEVTVTDSKTFTTVLGNRAKAIITFEDGTSITAIADRSIEIDETVEDLLFSTPGLSFYFSVESNGANPSVSNVMYNNVEGAILIKKHTNRDPVFPVNGTYECTTCNGHPRMNDGSPQTLNFVVESTTAPDGTNVATQVVAGPNTFNGRAVQDNEVDNGDDTTTADLNGDFMTVGNTSVTWSGTHTFSTGMAADCSEAAGTWSWVTNNFGTITGTFVNNDNCGQNEFTLYEEDFSDYLGEGLTPGATTTGSLDSNFIKITGLGSNTTDMDYGDTREDGDSENKYHRGSVEWTGSQGQPGLYDFKTGTDHRLGVQPKNGTFNAGFVDIRVQNTTGEELTEITISYDLSIINSGDGSVRLNSFYSTDNTTFNAINSLNYSSPLTAEASPTIETNVQTETISVTVPVDGFFYLQFKSSNDNSSGMSNAGDQDPLALDNISIVGTSS